MNIVFPLSYHENFFISTTKTWVVVCNQIQLHFYYVFMTLNQYYEKHP